MIFSIILISNNWIVVVDFITKNIYVSLGVLIVSILMLVYAYYCINVSGLNYMKNEFKLSIGFGILGTLLFFYGISSVALTLLQKNTNVGGLVDAWVQ